MLSLIKIRSSLLGLERELMRWPVVTALLGDWPQSRTYFRSDIQLFSRPCIISYVGISTAQRQPSFCCRCEKKQTNAMVFLSWTGCCSSFWNGALPACPGHVARGVRAQPCGGSKDRRTGTAVDQPSALPLALLSSYRMPISLFFLY
jgi:hypothetical protein